MTRLSSKTFMMKKSVFRWFRDISIAKKLYFTVGIMALLIAVELAVLIFSINTLSSVRAYVGGEGLWSKAQKDALYQLLKYARTHNEADYTKFEGEKGAMKALHLQPSDLKVPQRHGRGRGREDI